MRDYQADLTHAGAAFDDEAIVVSGLGVISAAGAGCEASLVALKAGGRTCGPVKRFATTIDKPVFEVSEQLKKWHGEGTRALDLALAAVEEALRSANLSPPPADLRVGVCLGTTVASQLNDLEFYRQYRETGTGAVAAPERFLAGNPAAALKRRYGFRGPDMTVVNACSSGADAIGVARDWLTAGLCDVVVAGGTDELNQVPLTGFHSLGILSDTPCRPFDRDRTGLNLGEGAGVVVLEKARTARTRGVRPSVACAGYGTYADAYHLTAPRPDGGALEKAVRRAMADARVAPGDVAFVNAHGTATPDNDRVEGATLARVFGPRICVCSTKGHTGHTLGAAGGIEAVFTVLALQNGWIPPTLGFENQDDDIPLSPTRTVTPLAGRHAVSTSLAFGGNNSALVFSLPAGRRR
ncbi:MAG: beta-ketoacyl-[acyl-carrier-protein] synthase family protein [Lentisphaeria bacterium]|nr:beta-ketoacyl-[acyl-carrier-protein] synthase family protein [Lentisphaeria bacterium]